MADVSHDGLLYSSPDHLPPVTAECPYQHYLGDKVIKYQSRLLELDPGENLLSQPWPGPGAANVSKGVQSVFYDHWHVRHVWHVWSPHSPLTLILPTSSPTPLSSLTKNVSVEPPPSSRHLWSLASEQPKRLSSDNNLSIMSLHQSHKLCYLAIFLFFFW